MAPQLSTRVTPATWGLLVLLGLIWGGSFFFARVAIPYVPPITLVFLRVFIAALALHIYIFGRYELYRTLRNRWLEFLTLGFINNAIPHTLIFAGQTEIGAGLAAILNATTPIWTVLITNIMTADEKMTPARLYGSLLGLIGTVFLVGPSAIGIATVPLWALLLPILAAMSYGLSATYGKRFKGLPAPVTAAGQLTGSSIIMLPLAAWHDQPWTLTMPPVSAIAAILGLALLSTAFGYILYFRIMIKAGATITSLVTLLVPPSAIILGFLFLSERLEIGDIAGMVLIGIGLLVIDGRIKLPFAHKR